MHDINTRALFGIDPSHPSWKTLRKAAKTFQFANQYGSSVMNSYRKMIVKVPDFQMTYADFEKMVNTSFKETYATYYKWREEQQRNVVKTREVRTLLGRVRRCFSDDRSIEKIALNTPSQGLAADIINTASIRVLKRLHVEVPTALLILQIHDQLVVECDKEDLKKVAAILSEEMSAPVKLTDELKELE
jgi:DNA polymerase-1